MKFDSSKDWQAQEDARILASYGEIMQDSSRKSKALKAAKALHKEYAEKASKYSKILKKK